MAIIAELERIFLEIQDNILSIEIKSDDELSAIEQDVQASLHLPEQIYEGCMHARVLPMGNTDERGVLLIRFEKELGLKKLPIHRHQFSSRKVLVLNGKGIFHFRHPETGVFEKVEVKRGSFVCFPQGLFHTFTTDETEMNVVAVHDPFQELDDEQILDFNEQQLVSSNEEFTKSPLKLRLK
jgi:quercetin dioxygenase-like cupin family protein